jgi:hypothetical protein
LAPGPDLARALHLDVKQDMAAVRQHPVDLRPERSIAAFPILRPLEEVTGIHPPLEPRVRKVDSVLPPGRGDRVVRRY